MPDPAYSAAPLRAGARPPARQGGEHWGFAGVGEDVASKLQDTRVIFL